MTNIVLYSNCPLCNEGEVAQTGSAGPYHCQHCGVTIKDSSRFFVINRGKYQVDTLGEQSFRLAEQTLKGAALSRDALKIALSNAYSDATLTELSTGNIEGLRPVQTVLAEIILEQLRENCFLEVRGIRRAHGPILEGEHSYQPESYVPQSSLRWQDEGNLFATTNRLVMPSNKFTFIRLGRSISTVKAFTNGIGVQQKKNDYATYFVGCYAHEAAAMAAYAIGKLPKPKS